MVNPLASAVTVSFEYTDAHISIVDDESSFQHIIDRCIKLCEVFDYDFELIYKRADEPPHCVFRVTFNYSVLSFQHNMNVLAAFAQEFQINMTHARVSESDSDEI